MHVGKPVSLLSGRTFASGLVNVDLESGSPSLTVSLTSAPDSLPCGSSDGPTGCGCVNARFSIELTVTASPVEIGPVAIVEVSVCVLQVSVAE